MHRGIGLLLILGLAGGARAETLRLHLLDVGEGQAVLLQHGDRGLLVDTGHAGMAVRVLGAIERFGIRLLDGIILTHLHPDHASGYFRLREAFPQTPVYDNGHPLPPRISPDMTRWVYETLGRDPLRRSLQAGKTLPWGDALLQVLWPAVYRDDNLNRHSLVLRLIHGQSRALLMGDADQTVERQLLKNGKALKAQVLVVGHHGASDAVDAEFLNRVQPDWSLISVNRDNPRGYPDGGTIERLRGNGSQVLRSDERGNICLKLPLNGRVESCGRLIAPSTRPSDAPR